MKASRVAKLASKSGGPCPQLATHAAQRGSSSGRSTRRWERTTGPARVACRASATSTNGSRWRARDPVVQVVLASKLEDDPEAADDVSTGSAARGAVPDQVIDDYKSSYASQFVEYDYHIQPEWVTGTLPPDLHGAFLQIGAGLLNVFGRKVRHPSDGDGMAVALSISGGRAFFRNRFVRTRAFQQEQALRLPLYRGAFDAGAPWALLPGVRLKDDTANEGLVHWDGHLYALGQSGLPYELHPLTLDTIGPSTLNGALGTAAKTPVGGHSHIVSALGDDSSADQRWVVYGAAQSGAGAVVTWREVREEGRQAAVRRYRVHGVMARTLHDFGVTEDFYVLFQSPLRPHLGGLTTGKAWDASLAECLTLAEGAPGRLHLVPRPGGRADGTTPLVFNTPPLVSHHLVNAYQHFLTSHSPVHAGTPAPVAPSPAAAAAGEGATTLPCSHVVVDMIAARVADYARGLLDSVEPSHFVGGPKPELMRLVADLTSKTVTLQVLSQRSAHATAIHPACQGRSYRYIYAAASAYDDALQWGPSQVLMKLIVAPPATYAATAAAAAGSVGTETWVPGPRTLLGQPVFVPRGASSLASGVVGREDEGWVLVMAHNAGTHTAQLHILAAADVSAGPIATVKLPHHLPGAQHAGWTPALVGWPAKGAPSGWVPGSAAA